MVGDHHHKAHGQRAAAQADDGAGTGVLEAVNGGGDQYQSAGGDNVHEETIDAVAAQEEGLDKGSEHGDDDAGYRTVGKRADQNRHVGGVILEKGGGGEQGEVDQRDENGADGGEHGQYGELLGAGIHKEHSFSDAGFRCAPCNGKHPKGINVFQVLKTWERCAFLNTSSSIQTSHPMGCVTVGPGVPPGRSFGERVADFTADRDFHPALKTSVIQLFSTSIIRTAPKKASLKSKKFAHKCSIKH